MYCDEIVVCLGTALNWPTLQRSVAADRHRRAGAWQTDGHNADSSRTRCASEHLHWHHHPQVWRTKWVIRSASSLTCDSLYPSIFAWQFEICSVYFPNSLPRHFLDPSHRIVCTFVQNIHFRIGYSKCSVRSVQTDHTVLWAGSRYFNEHFLYFLNWHFKGLKPCNRTPSDSYGVSLAMWDHTVLSFTRHKWTHTRLNPYQTGRYSIYLPRKDVRLSWLMWPVTYWDGLPVRRRFKY